MPSITLDVRWLDRAGILDAIARNPAGKVSRIHMPGILLSPAYLFLPALFRLLSLIPRGWF